MLNELQFGARSYQPCTVEGKLTDCIDSVKGDLKRYEYLLLLEAAV